MTINEYLTNVVMSIGLQLARLYLGLYKVNNMCNAT